MSDALAGQATFAEQLRAQRAVAAAEAGALQSVRPALPQRRGVSYLDLLDAQRSLFSAQQAAVQANLQRLQNQVTLYRVLGGGWTQSVPQAPTAMWAPSNPHFFHCPKLYGVWGQVWQSYNLKQEK